MVTIRPGTKRDVGRVVPMMVRAFWEFPESVHLLRNESARRRVLPAFMRGDLGDARRRDGLVVAEDDGRLVGALAYLPPGAYPISFRRQMRDLLPVVPVLPWAIGTAREADRGSAANRAHHQQHAEPHYFLRALGVDPSQQRQGIGNALITPVLARADDEHVGCFLFTATEANAAWYHSLGFESDEPYHPTPTWPLVWAMWRPPR